MSQQESRKKKLEFSTNIALNRFALLPYGHFGHIYILNSDSSMSKMVNTL